MIQDLKKGQTLLVRGPSRVTLLEGKLEIFGTIFESNSRSKNEGTYWGPNEGQNVIIVPGANSYPLYALEKAKIDVYTNLDAQYLKLIDENSIVEEWVSIKDSILERIKKETTKPLKIMVLGMSSGSVRPRPVDDRHGLCVEKQAPIGFHQASIQASIGDGSTC